MVTKVNTLATFKYQNTHWRNAVTQSHRNKTEAVTQHKITAIKLNMMEEIKYIVAS